MSNMNYVQLTTQENIQLGQCFNLAHAELVSRGINPSVDHQQLVDVTLALYKIKDKVNTQLQIEKSKACDTNITLLSKPKGHLGCATGNQSTVRPGNNKPKMEL